MPTKTPSQLAQLSLWVVAIGISLSALATEGWPWRGPLGLVGFCGIGSSVGGIAATFLGRGWTWVAIGAILAGVVNYVIQPQM